MKTQAEIVLRHLRGLAAGGDVPDGQLLERFTARRDETAFAALLRRHGPLVYGVCRRVLHNEHDAEDAFQATFLVLARKAGSIGQRDSVGSWLYQVARHVAMRARERAESRKKREGRAAARRAADPLQEISGRELLAAFDDELQKLPERDRAPLVLCYLQGLTRDEAARRLGCSESTLRRRLDVARERLRKRLERRGLALSAALLTAAASSAVPAALASATVRSAAGKAAEVPAAVAALVRQSLRTTAARAAKAVGAVLLAVGLVAAGAGLLAARGPAAAGAAAAATDEPKGAVAPKEPPDPPADEKDMAFAGRVVDADGKPAAGADVALLGQPKSNPPYYDWLHHKVLARGKSDAGGKFRLTAARTALAEHHEVYALAGKSGHGLAWARARLNTPGAETIVRLAPEKTIRGRLLDLQGQPAVGVRVRVSWVGTPEAPRAGGININVGALSREDFPAWPAPATTDKDGKFAIPGLNPDLCGYVHLESEDFAATDAEIKAGKENRNQEINLTLTPAQVLEGVVTAQDTGKPLPRTRVMLNSGAKSEADEKGRYRLRLPAGKSFTIVAEPPQGQPYLRQETGLEWPKGAVKHQLDLALARGVLVRGKVTDAATGKPVAEAIVHDATHLWHLFATTGADGTFAVVVRPGRGHLLVKGPNNDYVAVEITYGELQGGKRFGHRNYPDAVIPFDVKVGPDAVDVTAKLRRGVTIRGRLVGPDDKPAADAVMCCWNQTHQSVSMWFSAAMPVRDGRFELRGCDPEQTYPVYFLDPKNKLGATVRLSAKEVAGKEVTVRLEPCGSAVLRFVDKEGKLLPAVRPLFFFVARPEDKEVDADSDFVANVDRVNYSGGGTGVDEQGRCVYPVLIPGATYRLIDNDLKTIKELTVKAGEKLDKNVVIERPQ